MEPVSKHTSLNAAREQTTSVAPQRKGGFVQGAVMAQGCCGETNSGSTGCCGAPAQVVPPTPDVQLTTQGGCCGTAVPKTEAATTSSGCCG
jgi:hypothetical protein